MWMFFGIFMTNLLKNLETITYWLDKYLRHICVVLDDCFHSLFPTFFPTIDIIRILIFRYLTRSKIRPIRYFFYIDNFRYIDILQQPKYHCSVLIRAITQIRSFVATPFIILLHFVATPFILLQTRYKSR